VKLKKNGKFLKKVFQNLITNKEIISILLIIIVLL